jgi:two-component system, NtrC family, nitrogen regulation sensor histidine kinase NtrY
MASLMTLKSKLLLFFLLLHAVEMVIAFYVRKVNSELFVMVEAGILVSIVFSGWFYFSLTRPLDLIYAGIESIRNKDFNVRLKETGQKDLDRLIDVYNRMIDQLREEKITKHEQQFFLDQLLKVSPSGIIILDPDNRILMVNPAAAIFIRTEHDDAKGKKLDQLPSPLASELNKVRLNEKTIIHLSGLEKYKVTRSGFVNRGLRNQFFIIDEFTREIYKVERNAFENVIRLMSHEVNNSVGPVNSILDSVKNYINSFADSSGTDYTNALQVATEKNLNLNNFVRNYANVFKLPPPHFELIDLNKIAGEMVNFYKSEAAKRNIQIITGFHNKKIPVNIDVNQFEQVLKNVFCNAIEALEEEGLIVVSTTALPACLKIKNNGKPITPEIKKNIFKPFYSTKKNGQGIGLTLSREILHNHCCKFNLVSLQDGWTEFQIMFS